MLHPAPVTFVCCRKPSAAQLRLGSGIQNLPPHAADMTCACSTITPGNDFCGSISSDLASTPDGKGNRFDPEPATKNGDGGYDLPACPASMLLLLDWSSLIRGQACADLQLLLDPGLSCCWDEQASLHSTQHLSLTAWLKSKCGWPHRLAGPYPDTDQPPCCVGISQRIPLHGTALLCTPDLHRRLLTNHQPTLQQPLLDPPLSAIPPECHHTLHTGLSLTLPLPGNTGPSVTLPSALTLPLTHVGCLQMWCAQPTQPPRHQPLQPLPSAAPAANCCRPELRVCRISCSKAATAQAAECEGCIREFDEQDWSRRFCKT